MPTDIVRLFTQAQLEKIAKCLGFTSGGLTGSEIGYMLKSVGMEDTDPTITKWKRLYNAFINEQNTKRAGNKILTFIAKSLDPVRFVDNTNMFRVLSDEVNSVLAFHGLEYREDGKFYTVQKITTLTESQNRVENLKMAIIERHLNKELLKYCHEELVVDNYFHAVFEATKGLFDVIRNKFGLTGDGADLIERAFTGSDPIIKINLYKTQTEKSEQSGFVNLLKGIYGVFRNPIAHEIKSEWPILEQDALDLFSTLSYLYRRIEGKKEET